MLEQSDNGWWLVNFEGERGWAPAKFLKPKKTLPSVVSPRKVPIISTSSVSSSSKSLPQTLSPSNHQKRLAAPLRPLSPSFGETSSSTTNYDSTFDGSRTLIAASLFRLPTPLKPKSANAHNLLSVGAAGRTKTDEITPESSPSQQTNKSVTYNNKLCF